MSTSSQYNLTFYIESIDGFIPKPSIGYLNSSGIKNREIVSFLEPNGVEGVNSISFDIQALLQNGEPVHNINIWGYHDSECIELSYLPPQPAVIVFNRGGSEVFVPANDFLQILDEWKAFVVSVPTPHWLENR